MPMKIIKDEGPHYRVGADILYLDELLKTNNNYLYCLDLVDHFSKFLFCYLLENKTMPLVVSKIKLFFLEYGKCKIFQTDNSLEFKNKELRIFLENEGIKLIFSRPRHPQKNGCVESIHKIVRKNLLIDYYKNKNNFYIDISLTNFLIFYNNSINTVTKKNLLKSKIQTILI